MKYAQHRSTRRSRRSGPSKTFPKWMFGLGALIAVVIVILIIVLRKPVDTPGEATEFLENMTSESVELDDVTEESIDTAAIVDTIELESLVGAQYSASASRGIEDGLFVHVVVASLPPIDLSTHFYEGWLVKPGVTEFFSTGEMFPRADGKWGLVWEIEESQARRDIFDFSKVIITKEPRDDDPAPSVEHVLEGTFAQ